MNTAIPSHRQSEATHIATLDGEAEPGLHFIRAETGPKLQAQLDRIEKAITGPLIDDLVKALEQIAERCDQIISAREVDVVQVDDLGDIARAALAKAGGAS